MVDNKLSQTDSELLITTLYIFYAEKVIKGIDEEISKSLEWLLPRKQISYTSLLDSIMLHPDDISKQKKVLFNQYYKLRDVLQKYREIEKKGGWVNVEVNADFKVFKPGDSASQIGQIRDRLFITGELKQNNKSTTYDDELVEAIQKFQQQNGKNLTDKEASQLNGYFINTPSSPGSILPATNWVVILGLVIFLKTVITISGWPVSAMAYTAQQ